jgi:hypothetical protein
VAFALELSGLSGVAIGRRFGFAPRRSCDAGAAADLAEIGSTVPARARRNAAVGRSPRGSAAAATGFTVRPALTERLGPVVTS